jgi:tetratricopeptide (TPR) repeat protein
MIRWLLALMFAGCFTLATVLAPRFNAITARETPASSPLAALLGDSRRLFANQFFSMADVYYHSGYYPTIFDAKKEGPTHLDVSSRDDKKEKEPDLDDNFMGKPKDWIEKFGRYFIPTIHTHLSGRNSREILPWLKLSAELDPKRIETYVTAAYWLRTSLNRPDEAEQFLRTGLRANPDSDEILLELGRVYYYGRTNAPMARNLWEDALKKWYVREKADEKPDPDVREEILGELVRDDELNKNFTQELADLRALKKVAADPASIDQRIAEVKKKMSEIPAAK